MDDRDFTIVIVTWFDAVRHSDGEGAPRHVPAKQIAIGWQIKRDDKGISLCDELSAADGSWRGEHFIRDCDIESIVELEVVDE